MWVNQIFSLIDDTGTIQNIIVCDNYEIANQIARMSYENDAYAIDTTQYPVSVGCKHIDGRFYQEDGVTEILRNPTPDEQIVILEAEKAALAERLSMAEGVINMLIL